MSETVDAAFRAAWTRLKDAGIESARTDARLLVGHILGGGPERVLAEGPRDLTPEEADALEALLARRLDREPMSHIFGAREFWSLNFKVTGATLTPRPDTEALIEAVLDLAGHPAASVLDLGTGTGCILLALLSEWPDAEGVGIDASDDALAVARDNAQALGMASRTRFVRADWRHADWMRDVSGPFEVVVSNPPYIPAADITGLDRDVREYEPHLALDGGVDGLDAYRAILAGVDRLVAENGLLAFEVGLGQADEVAELMTRAGLEVLEQRRDLGGIARAVVGRNVLDNKTPKA